MSKFVGSEFDIAKEWIADKKKNGFTWESIANFCVDEDEIDDESERLFEDWMLDDDLTVDLWKELVYELKEKERYLPIASVQIVTDGSQNDLITVPTSRDSSWCRYKESLLKDFSASSVDNIECYSHRILSHLKLDTRDSGPVKGLVVGSVQSGKTANMIGLMTMAGDYNWNLIIVLSGSIENLRVQTRDRIYKDLSNTNGNVIWHMLERSSNPKSLKDLNTSKPKQSGELITVNGLRLNSFTDGKATDKWQQRYVTVCLKNSSRLRNLINWLQRDRSVAAKLRILVIDDEADQASINTKPMPWETPEDLLERTTINNLIINLVNGKTADGELTDCRFQAMNYISFTATPYANVLNEAYRTSLYPSNFICSLPDSHAYFGLKTIFGSKSDERYDGLNIVRTIPEDELIELDNLHKGIEQSVPGKLKEAIAWFLCTAAVSRLRDRKKPLSMLIHTSMKSDFHFNVYNVIRSWLSNKSDLHTKLELCRSVYEKEIASFQKIDLEENFADYENLTSVDEEMPGFSEIRSELVSLLDEVRSIELSDSSSLSYSQKGIHLCVDNCYANRMAEEGTHLRIVYPSKDQLKTLNKAPVFIVIGGNTLSRGLTIEGLTSTYFTRESYQADTLLQMARWFGYRVGYELLPRIWMPKKVIKKFELLSEVDEALKVEIERFMKMGLSPSTFGPKVLSTGKISRFMLTASNKSQNAINADMDYSGDSYEVTEFADESLTLKSNISVTEEFLNCLGNGKRSEAVAEALVWRTVNSSLVMQFLSDRYKFFKESSMTSQIPTFCNWMKEENSKGNFLHWNVVLAGDSTSDKKWMGIGKISRTKKPNMNHIDIGSLRSGTDALADVDIDCLTEQQRHRLAEVKRMRKDYLKARDEFGLTDNPLLLIYRIDKDGNKEKPGRLLIKSSEDIIALSIVISGESVGKEHVKAMTVRIPKD